MNKAFVREPEDDGRAYCPRCKTLGVPVEAPPMDTHIRPESRARMHDAAWFCSYPRCDVAYFNQYDVVVLASELVGPIYPKDAAAPLCACFGFTYDDVQADVDAGTPTRIRELLAKSKSPAARCRTLAPDGKCCLPAVQELYMKLRASSPT
jgi:hypothetical protein